MRKLIYIVEARDAASKGSHNWWEPCEALNTAYFIPEEAQTEADQLNACHNGYIYRVAAYSRAGLRPRP